MSRTLLKFLVDIGVGKKVEAWLSGSGFDVKAARDIDPRMSDRAMLNLAAMEMRMVITMDKDFGELVYHSGLPHAGVLLLRLDEAKADEKVKAVEAILTKHTDKLASKFCVFQNGKLRVRG